MKKIQEITLNIRYDLPTEIWKDMITLYSTMEGWKNFGDGSNGDKDIPYWFSFNENEKHISASLEPSGLQLSGFLSDEEWNIWIDTFIQKTSKITGYQVKDAES